MAFDVELSGLSFGVDAAPEFGGKNHGPSPKPLVLSALAGCTGMDVVSILNKMQMPFDSLAIEVDGTLGEEHPKVYTAIRIRYIVAGGRAELAKIEKAVKLSLDKYCGVAAMLGKTAAITHEIVLNA
jgi:putative redox protein